MNISQFFKSIIDQDTAAVVICDTEHKIVCMNPASVNRYSKMGGAELLGISLLNCRNQKSNGIG